jgi:tetratricopeptide (TPR) repeat protein
MLMMTGSTRFSAFLLSVVVSTVHGAEPLARATVQTQQFDIHYRAGASSIPLTEVELWYTVGPSKSWRLFGRDTDRVSPVTFLAPHEGRYGFYLVLKNAYGASSPPPNADAAPQQRVFIDFTPPVAQLHEARIDPSVTDGRRLLLRWTAFDNNLPPRPIGLAYRPVGALNWSWIADRLPNRGRYDWVIPDQVAGPVDVRLIVCDRSGHTVERTLGPVQLDRPKPTPPPAATESRPPDPVQRTFPVVTEAKSRAASDRYDLGTFHRVRGEYAIAAQMYREALALNPNLNAARHDLAGVQFKQGEIEQAIATYQTVLEQDPNHTSAHKGLALAYLKRRDYGNARSRLSDHLSLEPNDAHGWLVLGDVARLSGDARAARGYWSKALTVDPKHHEMIKRATERLSTSVTSAVGRTNGARR